MRTSPSIVPRDEDVYLVEVDLGHWGRVWTEADSEATDRETLVRDMLAGQHRNPIRVVAFNVSQGWSRDVSDTIAQELRRRRDLEGLELPAGIADFVERMKYCAG
jgi:hypothetical protein